MPVTAENRDRLALVGICLGFLLVLFDATAVNVAVESVRRSIGGSDTTIPWVLNAYTVAFAALMLAAGSLGDRWGSRRCFLAGLGVFAVASAACAAAPSVGVLITARAVQGAGAAAIVPCSLALIAHRFPSGPARSQRACRVGRHLRDRPRRGTRRRRPRRRVGRLAGRVPRRRAALARRHGARRAHA